MMNQDRYNESEKRRPRRIPEETMRIPNVQAAGRTSVRQAVDYKTGLTRSQVEERMAQGLSNVAVDSSARSTKDIIKGNLFTYFNLIFSVLAVLLCMVGSFRNLTFLPVIIVNTLL